MWNRAEGAISTILLLCALLLPSFTCAQTAGFASSSLWISKNSVKAGEDIVIYTALFNSSSGVVVGTVNFNVDGKLIGSSKFELEAGISRIASLRWNATEGSHTFSAEIEANDLGITNSKSSEVRIAVLAPDPSPLVEYKNTISSSLSATFASTSPKLEMIANAIVGTTEVWRKSGKEYLSDIVSSSTPSSRVIAPTSQGTAVLGTSTIRASASAGTVVYAVQNTILRFLLMIFSSASFFYPIFAVLFFLLLYALKRWVNRPRF